MSEDPKDKDNQQIVAITIKITQEAKNKGTIYINDPITGIS